MVCNRCTSHLQCIPSTHSVLFVGGPVIADGRDGILCIRQTAVVCVETCRRILIRPPVTSSEGLSNNKGSVHDDSEVAVSPAQTQMRKCVLWRNSGGFGKGSRDLCEPRLYALLVEFDELLGAGKRLAYYPGVDVVCGKMKGGLDSNTSVWRNIGGLWGIVERVGSEFLVVSC